MPFGTLKLAALHSGESLHDIAVHHAARPGSRIHTSLNAQLPHGGHGDTDGLRHEIEDDRQEAQREIDQATREERSAEKDVLKNATTEESEAEMQELERMLGNHAHHIGRVANTKYTESGELDGRDPFIDEPPASTGQCINPGQEDAAEDLSML
eukprot:1185885-Amphidinium_carterae.1